MNQSGLAAKREPNGSVNSREEQYIFWGYRKCHTFFSDGGGVFFLRNNMLVHLHQLLLLFKGENVVVVVPKRVAIFFSIFKLCISYLSNC